MGERERKWEKGERLQVLQVLRLSLSFSVCVWLLRLYERRRRRRCLRQRATASSSGGSRRRLTFIGASPPVRDVADRCVLASCGVTGVSRAFNYTCTCTRTRASNTHGSAILREGVAEDVECRAL